MTPPINGKPGKKMIFDNELVTALVIQFKQNGDIQTYQRIIEETSNLMDAIIRKRKFHLNAPFGDIKNNMFLQFNEWVDKFDPSKPTTCYSYFSASIKNSALSYVKKEYSLREKICYTDVPMEAFDSAYTQNFDADAKQIMREALANIHCRWRESNIKEAIRFLIATILQNRGERRVQITRTLTSGFDLSSDTARFIIDWTQGAVRAALLEQYDQPLGPVDLLRVQDKFSFVPDMINLIGVEATIKLITVFAGQTIKMPSHTKVRRIQSYRHVYDNLAEDPTPDNFAHMATQLRTTPKKLEEYYEQTTANILDGVLEDHPVFDDDHGPPLF